MSPSQDRQPRGFSLLEIVAAVAMFAVIVVSLLGIFANGYLYARQMRMASKAYFYAQQIIEEYYNASVVFPDPQKLATNVTSTALSDANFTYTVNFTNGMDFNDGDGAHDELAEINVTVYWPGRNNQQRSYSLVTYIANFTGGT